MSNRINNTFFYQLCGCFFPKSNDEERIPLDPRHISESTVGSVSTPVSPPEALVTSIPDRTISAPAELEREIVKWKDMEEQVRSKAKELSLSGEESIELRNRVRIAFYTANGNGSLSKDRAEVVLNQKVQELIEKKSIHTQEKVERKTELENEISRAWNRIQWFVKEERDLEKPVFKNAELVALQLNTRKRFRQALCDRKRILLPLEEAKAIFKEELGKIRAQRKIPQ